MDKKIKDLKDRLMSALREYGDRAISAQNVEMIEKLAVAIDKICKIEKMDGDYDYSMSADRRYYMDGWGDNSYRGDRGGSYTVRGRYSRADGKEKMVSELEEMMYNADEHEKNALRKAISALKEI